MAVQPDGKIVAVGSVRSDFEFGVVRYNPDGSVDSSFGTGGYVAATYGFSSAAYAVALQPDGKIVVAGTSAGIKTGGDFAVARYNANGSPDTGFGTNGLVTTDLLGHDDVATGVALQPDGKIVAAGKANTGSVWDFAVVRYTASGSVDTTFGTNGTVTTSLGSGDSVANALLRQPDGKLVVAGYNGTATSSQFALARYTPEGALDPSFGSGGKVITPVASGQGAFAAALEPDGKIVSVGETVGATFSIALVRYDADGTLDPSFGEDGIAGGVEGFGRGVTIQPDGKILVAGDGFNESRSNTGFSISRYEPDGLPDVGFGTGGNGFATTSIGSGNSSADAVALQPDGKIVVAGTTEITNSDYDFALTRYFAGSLSVEKAGDGSGVVRSAPVGIQCGPTCYSAFDSVPVTLTATPSARSAFAGWSGDCSGNGTCTLTISTERSVVAKFIALCIVPKVTGRKLKSAKAAIRQAHCSVGKIRSVFSQKVKKGRLISQKPRPGTKLPGHSKVRLTVSKGRR